MIRMTTAALALALVAGAAQAQPWDRGGHGRGEHADDGGSRGGHQDAQDQGGQKPQSVKAPQAAPPAPPGPPEGGHQDGRRGQAGGDAQVQGGGGNPGWQGRHGGGPRFDGGPQPAPPAAGPAVSGGQNTWSGEGRRGHRGGEWTGGQAGGAQPGAVQGDPRAGAGDRRWHGDGSNPTGNDGRRWNGERDGRRGDGSWNGGSNPNWNDGRNWSGQSGGYLPGAHAPRYRDRGRSWYDNNRWRQSYWGSHRYRIRPYIYPRGWFLQRWSFGDYLPFGWYTPSYYLDAWAYGLPQPPIGCEWVREGNDALLVDIWSGEILSVYYNLFW